VLFSLPFAKFPPWCSKRHIFSVLFKRLLKREIEASVELKPGKQLRILWDEDSKVREEWKQLLGHVLFFSLFLLFLISFEVVRFFLCCWFLIIPI
jgi:hypothetical protein